MKMIKKFPPLPPEYSGAARTADNAGNDVNNNATVPATTSKTSSVSSKTARTISASTSPKTNSATLTPKFMWTFSATPGSKRCSALPTTATFSSRSST